ncbi:MAG: hypothetical protein IIB83_09820 [Bacteroidetes bacterium]|nr:hypothetical protein [Bacteroidota bacterium]
MTDNKKKLVNIAILLAFITITYNTIEGIISVYFGTTDDTLALLGFGVDSFVEVISGGKYAFMLPGLLAKKPEIMKLLIKELKRRGLAA